MTDFLKIDRDGHVVTLTLNRPEKRNALDLTMRAAIANAMRELEADAEVRAIVITGGESVFAAGADLSGLFQLFCAFAEQTTKGHAKRGRSAALAMANH